MKLKMCHFKLRQLILYNLIQFKQLQSSFKELPQSKGKENTGLVNLKWYIVPHHITILNEFNEAATATWKRV